MRVWVACSAKFRRHTGEGAMVHGLCRDKAVSLSFGLRYITNSIWPMLHAYLLHGYYVEAGTLLRSLVQIVTPSRWNVIIWWNLISFCKARQCEERRNKVALEATGMMNMLQEIFGVNSQWYEYVTRNMTTKAHKFHSIQRCIAMVRSMPLLNH